MTSADLIAQAPKFQIPYGYALVRWEATDTFQPGHLDIVLSNIETDHGVSLEFGPETTRAALESDIAASITHAIANA